jgi:hypothetical protein
MAIVWSINNIPQVSAIGLTVLAVTISYTWRFSLPQFTSALQAALPTLPSAFNTMNEMFFIRPQPSRTRNAQAGLFWLLSAKVSPLMIQAPN